MTRNIPSEIELAGVGVVLGADPHIPALLTPEFLSESKIVPSEWVVQESMSSAHGPLSQIAYENLFFQLDDDVLRVFEKCELGFETNYDVFEVALKYLDKSSGSFHTVALNMGMYIIDDQPSEWIGDKFYKEQKLVCLPNTRIIETGFSFSLDAEQEDEQKQLFLNFDPGSTISLGQEDQQAVIVNAGIVLRSQNKHSLKDHISKWKNTHTLILSYLSTMTLES